MVLGVLRHLCSNTLDELIEIDFIVIFNSEEEIGLIWWVC
jgi:hypothetical protein